MDLRTYLEQSGVRYQWLEHAPTYTSQELAQTEHISGHNVVKPVLVQADGHFVMAVLPASHKIDLERLRTELRAQNVSLADETQLRVLFSDCEVGAEPPIGQLYGVPMIMDDSLMRDKDIAFQAGTHQDAVRMSFEDFLKLSKPSVGHFTRPA